MTIQTNLNNHDAAWTHARPRLDDRAREVLRGMAEEIVRSYLGEPNRKLSNKRQLRWHPKGSFALHVASE